MPSPMPQPTILLAEDEAPLRELLALLLEEEGYQVVSVPDGDQALSFVMSKGQPLDLLLSDIKMPGSLNGVQLAQRVKSLRPGLQMILMSGNPTSEHLPPSDLPFLHKPFAFSQLIALINLALTNHRA